MKSIKTKTNRTSNLAIFLGLFLAVVSAIFIFAPAIKTNAAEKSAEVNVSVNPIISISLDKNALSFDITPTSAGVFDSGSIIATVDTNSTGGYELYFSSEDSSTAMTSLVSESVITSDFNSAVTSSSMSANKWGYSLGATYFNKIPALADQVKIKDLDHYPTSSEKDTTVTIGTKIDSTLPSGTYSKKVVFSAIAHPSPVPNVNRLVDLTSMQDSNLARYCAETYTPTKNTVDFSWNKVFYEDLVPRASVQDTRDGKYYLISKLADGNCWMSQNLELVLNKNTELTSGTTDLNTKTSWTPENSSFTTAPTSSNWSSSNDIASAAALSYYPIASDRYYQGGTVKSSTPTASGVEYDWEKAGVYYNWYAATAGSGTYAMTSGNAEDSICPKGWRLPLGTTEDKSFYYLLTTKYGGVSPASMLRSPFNFIYSGQYIRSGMMYYQGEHGFLWSSTVYTQAQIKVLEYYSTIVSPSTNNNKGHGASVRCVAR